MTILVIAPAATYGCSSPRAFSFQPHIAWIFLKLHARATLDSNSTLDLSYHSQTLKETQKMASHVSRPQWPPHERRRLTFAAQQHKRSLRDRFALPLSESLYNSLIAILAEFIGITFFLFFAFAGCQVANTSFTRTPDPAGTANLPTSNSSANLLYETLSISFSLAVNAWVFFRITSALFNPAITLGMCLIGSLDWRRGLGVFISQILGGMTAAGLVSGLLPGKLRAETVLGNGTSVVRGFCEYGHFPKSMQLTDTTV